MTIKEGDRIRVTKDSDGDSGVRGVVVKVFKSGRCMVQLDNRNLRNIPSEGLEVEISNR